MNLRYLLSAWRTIKLPGLIPIMRDWIAFLRMHFLYAALDAGLLQALTTPASRDVLIQRLGVKRPELLDALLDMGQALKELSISRGVYRIKGKRAKALAVTSNDALAAVIQANVTYYNAAYRHLAGRMRGAPLGDDLKDIGETVARFAKIGEPMVESLIKELLSGEDAPILLDVGCGSGFVLNTARRANPAVTGTGIDSDPKVAEQARENLTKWSLNHCFSIVTGDIRSYTDQFKAGFDLITAFNLIYYIPTDRRVAFFAMLRSFLSAGGRLALVNSFDSRGKDPSCANLNLINCSLEGLTALPDLEQTRAQLIEGGFDNLRVSQFMPKSEFYSIIACNG